MAHPHPLSRIPHHIPALLLLILLSLLPLVFSALPPSPPPSDSPLSSPSSSSAFLPNASYVPAWFEAGWELGLHASNGSHVLYVEPSAQAAVDLLDVFTPGVHWTRAWLDWRAEAAERCEVDAVLRPSMRLLALWCDHRGGAVLTVGTPAVRFIHRDVDGVWSQCHSSLPLLLRAAFEERRHQQRPL